MRNSQVVRQRLNLKQIPAPKVIQFQSLLAATVQDLSTVVRQILARNIFFDGVKEDTEVESLSDAVGQDFDEDIANLYNRSEEEAGYKMAGDGPAMVNDMPDDRKKYLSTEEGVIDDLKRQLEIFNISSEQKEIGLYFIHSLNDQGFIVSPESTINHLVQNSAYDSKIAHETLSYLQAHADPVGVFARDVRESFQIQIARLQNSPIKATLQKIFEDRYDDLLSKNLNGLKAYLKVDNYEIIDDVYQVLQSFNPIPISSQAAARAVKSRGEPDFIVRQVDGLYEVRSTKRNFLQIRVNGDYSNTLAALHKERKFKDPVYRFLKNERRNLNETIVMLRDRQEILEEVVSYVLNKQSAYLKQQDEEQIIPLLVKDTASEFGIDASTVSRIAREKIIQTEGGEIINLADLFSLGIRTASGMRTSIGDIKDKIRTLIAGEDRTKPLTDVEIEKDLKEMGMIISSANVRRIREDMKISDSRHRKTEYAMADMDENDDMEFQKGQGKRFVETREAIQAVQLKFRM